MDRPEPNLILETALSLIDATAPGAFDDPREAWRKCVESLRYVVIDQADDLSVAQLKAIQDFSTSFYRTKARNLLEIRKELSVKEIRLEPAPENFAQIALEALLSESVLARMVPLTEAEKHERLKILDDLPPNDAPHDAADSGAA